MTKLVRQFFEITAQYSNRIVYICNLKANNPMNRAPNTYPAEEETCNNFIASESAMALEEQEAFVLPEEMDYASIVEGILQVTPDLEEELAAVDRGETVSMDEFKTMFAQWLD